MVIVSYPSVVHISIFLVFIQMMFIIIKVVIASTYSTCVCWRSCFHVVCNTCACITVYALTRQCIALTVSFYTLVQTKSVGLLRELHCFNCRLQHYLKFISYRKQIFGAKIMKWIWGAEMMNLIILNWFSISLYALLWFECILNVFFTIKRPLGMLKVLLKLKPSD